MADLKKLAGEASHDLARAIERATSVKQLDTELGKIVINYRGKLNTESPKLAKQFDADLVLRHFTLNYGHKTPEEYFYTLEGNDLQEGQADQMTPREIADVLRMGGDWLKKRQEIQGSKDEASLERAHEELAFISGDLVELQRRYGFKSVNDMYQWAKQQRKVQESVPVRSAIEAPPAWSDAEISTMASRIGNGEHWLDVINDMARNYAVKNVNDYSPFEFAAAGLGRAALEKGLISSTPGIEKQIGVWESALTVEEGKELSTKGGVKSNGRHSNAIGGDPRKPKNKGVSANPGFLGASHVDVRPALQEAAECACGMMNQGVSLAQAADSVSVRFEVNRNELIDLMIDLLAHFKS